MALFRLPNSLLVFGALIALMAGSQIGMEVGDPARHWLLVAFGVAMIVVALIYRKVRPHA